MILCEVRSGINILEMGGVFKWVEPIWGPLFKHVFFNEIYQFILCPHFLPMSSFGSLSEQKLIIEDENMEDNSEEQKFNKKNCSKNRHHSRFVSEESSPNEEDERESEGPYNGSSRVVFKQGNKGKLMNMKKRNYDIMSSDDEVHERVSEKMLWKIVKAKYLYTFKLCKICNDRLFRDPKKFAYKGDLLRVSVMLCPECVRLNIAATDLLEGTATKAKKDKKFDGSWKKKKW